MFSTPGIGSNRVNTISSGPWRRSSSHGDARWNVKTADTTPEAVGDGARQRPGTSSAGNGMDMLWINLARTLTMKRGRCCTGPLPNLPSFRYVDVVGL